MSDEQKMPDVIYASDSSCDMMYGKWWRSKELDHYQAYLRCPDHIDPKKAMVVSEDLCKRLCDIDRERDEHLATLTAERDALVEAASQLRQAQRDYMADRGNDAKGKIVGQKAKALDATLAQLKEQDDE